MMAAVSDYVLAAPVAFAVGLLVGFWLSNRYRVVKRDDTFDREGVR